MVRSDNLAPVRLEVIEAHGVRRDDDGWEHYSYDVRLTRGDESMRSPWKAGLALDEPTAVDVLESLILDAQGFYNVARGSVTPEAFEDWAHEYGYDSDSRKAYALFLQVATLTDNLHELLGSEDFETAMQEDAEKAAAYLVAEDV